MAQKRIEEKLEAFDQDISEIRVELHKLPTIEENLSSTARGWVSKRKNSNNSNNSNNFY